MSRVHRQSRQAQELRRSAEARGLTVNPTCDRCGAEVLAANWAWHRASCLVERPREGTIVFDRATRQVLLNGTPIPHQVRRHSPDGFEWGYGGSGPAELALNLLLQFLPLEQANDLYQQFKWDFIAPMPHAGGTLAVAQVWAWLAKQGVPVEAQS